MNDPSMAHVAQPLLRRYLLRWALGAVVVVWLTLIAVAWATGLREARKFSDGQLVAVARFWVQSVPAPAVSVGPAELAQLQHEYLQDMAILDWKDGQLISDSHGLAPGLSLSALPVSGFANVVYRAGELESERRAYVVTFEQNGHQRRIAVLMDLKKRAELGNDIAEHIAEPAVLVFPLVALFLWWAIRRGLRPLDRLSFDVAALDGIARRRLDPEHRFREFNSTVYAINTLMETLEKQAQRERAFASDVAHELRTPLAAMTLLASAAQADPTPERLAQLEKESLRAGRILAQLLDLARAQRAGSESRVQGQQPLPVNVGELALAQVAAHAQEAHETRHELSFSQPDHLVTLPVAPMLLELALRNLIDNALKHTPPHTQVNVELEASGSVISLSVSDDGGHRAAGEEVAESGGLGLGLRLVERLAQEMGAVLVRDDGVPPMSTRFTLRWGT
ncbi:MAG: histidine kinase dimerization/phospho-acceptor domain-containing protein [Burkholderiaceae bacterium]